MIGRKHKKSIFSEKVQKEPIGDDLKFTINLSIYSFVTMGS